MSLDKESRESGQKCFIEQKRIVFASIIILIVFNSKLIFAALKIWLIFVILFFFSQNTQFERNYFKRVHTTAPSYKVSTSLNMDKIHVHFVTWYTPIDILLIKRYIDRSRFLLLFVIGNKYFYVLNRHYMKKLFQKKNNTFYMLSLYCIKYAWTHGV